MTDDKRFGLCAQTPAQRAWVLQQMQAMIPRLQASSTTDAGQLYARYVAGELSWQQVRQALNEVRPDLPPLQAIAEPAPTLLKWPSCSRPPYALPAALQALEPRF